ncbi:MAG: hypothetical protein EZS28_027283 [Streblomastix strix]|uniref:Uncharacterized protein n=1 Tax=Streblomastix strix TaxID=222440 RepID=A0A5J4V511_9EUKA|nr:MAG: hypothetical protein EZS28_027283 [Streblomastix strix]
MNWELYGGFNVDKQAANTLPQIEVGQGDELTYLGQIIDGANKLEDDLKAPLSPKEDQQLIVMSQKMPNYGKFVQDIQFATP